MNSPSQPVTPLMTVTVRGTWTKPAVLPPAWQNCPPVQLQYTTVQHAKYTFDHVPLLLFLFFSSSPPPLLLPLLLLLLLLLLLPLLLPLLLLLSSFSPPPPFFLPPPSLFLPLPPPYPTPQSSIANSYGILGHGGIQ